MLRSVVLSYKIIKNTNNGVFSVFHRKNRVWSNDNIVKSPFENVDIPKLSIDDYMWQNLDKWPTKTAVVGSDTKKQYTYEQLYKKSRVFGAKLRKLFKIQDGDNVAIVMPNIIEFPIVVFGILAAGGVVTLLNPAYTAHEIHKLEKLAKAKLLIAPPEIIPTIKEALLLSEKDLPIISIDTNIDRYTDTISFKELMEDNTDLSILNSVRVKSSDVAFLPFSSGTTGLPKGVELTNRNMVSNCQQQNTECRHFNYTTGSNQDTVLVALPLFHSYGLSILMLHKLSVGLKLVFLPKFKPESLVNSLAEFDINLLYIVPPIVLMLSSLPEVTPEHLKHLSMVMCGAAPLPKVDVQRFSEKAERDIFFAQGYGLTETSPLATVSPLGYRNIESVGFALPNVELRVIDENTNNLGPNEVGELLIKGPNVMKGYKDNPEANSQVFLPGGWFRSGDLAKIDETGAVYVVDRLKELIKVNGFQVPPAELENVIKKYSGVFDVAVIGVPDPNTGERTKAFIVPKNGVKIDEDELKSFVSKRVAPYKKLREIVIVDSIPKNPSGKILRRLLK